MYKYYFNNYLNSKEYYCIENDFIYQELTKLLNQNLSKDIYLNVEELLHAEILFKLEQGFHAGYCSQQ